MSLSDPRRGTNGKYDVTTGKSSRGDMGEIVSEPTEGYTHR